MKIDTLSEYERLHAELERKRQELHAKIMTNTLPHSPHKNRENSIVSFGQSPPLHPFQMPSSHNSSNHVLQPVPVKEKDPSPRIKKSSNKPLSLISGESLRSQ